MALDAHWSSSELVGDAPLPELGGNAGIGLGDLDGDGWLDAVVVTPVGSVVLHNDGAGTLVPVHEWMGEAWPAATGIALADLDGDGDLDAWLGRLSGTPDLLLWNEGSAGMIPEEIAESDGESYSGSFSDMDGDGDLDLFVARYAPGLDLSGVLDGTLVGDGNAIYRNESGAMVWLPGALPADVVDDVSFHGQWLDADEDGHPDLYLASDFGPFLGRNRLLLGDGAGGFSPADECACDLAMFGMGVGVGDANGDGRVDLYITDLAGPDLLLGEGGGRFYSASLSTGAGGPDDGAHLASWGTAMVDLNGDGWVDLPMVFGRVDPGGDPAAFEDLGPGYDGWLDIAGQRDVVLLSDGAGQFLDASAESGFEDDGDGRALAVGDFDRDGRPDLLTAGMWFAQHWRGEGGCEARVVLELPAARHGLGLGARVSATISGRTQTHWMQPSTTWSSSEHAVFIGLGTADQIDQLEVEWMDGSRRSWAGIAAGSRLVLRP